ncbi:MAG: hypothetical protein HY293_18200 [Planctomycetes bacterium]|nr:hypothetical protein [Planctomycetota bacterium]
MKRAAWTALGIILFLVLLFGILIGFIDVWLIEALVHLATGWAIHAFAVLPQVTLNWSGLGMLVVCLLLTAGLGHRFCRWLWAGTGHADPWRPRWTAAGLGIIVLMFAAGMAVTAVAHQTGWLLRGPATLVDANSRASFERNGFAALRSIYSAQMAFASRDLDENGVKDYWRKDIAGLFAFTPSTGQPLKLIQQSVACADAASAVDLGSLGGKSAKLGYWFKSLKFPDETTPDPKRFAALAYPDNPSAGKYFFIISDEGTTYRKRVDQGARPDTYPIDPDKEGWSKLD